MTWCMCPPGRVVETHNSTFFFQAEDGIRDLVRSRGLEDVYKGQASELLREKEENGGIIPVTSLYAQLKACTLCPDTTVAA